VGGELCGESCCDEPVKTLLGGPLSAQPGVGLCYLSVIVPEQPDREPHLHPSVVVDEGVSIGPATQIWHFCHLSSGARIGARCTLGQNVFVGRDVSIGSGVKVQNNVSVYAGVTLEDDVFVGPSVVFTNVKNPRAPIDRKHEFQPTLVKRGATVGANATILCGVTLGEYCMVGAGAVVTRDVPAHAVVVGNPARLVGQVDEEGHEQPPTGAASAGKTIRLLDPVAENASFQGDLEEAALAVLRTGDFILGQHVRKFEEECADFLGVEHAIAVSSGSDALLMSLLAAGIGPGDEVLTSPFSFFATVEAIVRVGAVPRFVDITPDGFLMDVHRLAARLTRKTKAVIAVHLFGQALDWAAVRAELAARGVALIEDAAQAFGAEGHGGRLGVSAFSSCFSFFPSKNLGGFGDGGLVTTDNANTAETLRRLRVHGAVQKYHHAFVGGNFRLDALQAALLSVKLKHVPELLRRRQHNAEYYFERLGPLAAAEGFILPSRTSTHTYHQFVIQTNDRDTLQAALAREGIETAVYYPLSLARQPALLAFAEPNHALPHCDAACARVLALPVQPGLTRSDLERVSAAVESFFFERNDE